MDGRFVVAPCVRKMNAYDRYSFDKQVTPYLGLDHCESLDSV
jgi:hypothetical protein